MQCIAEQDSHLSVLYVEDNPVNALLMGALFQHRPNLELVVATTGQQALCIASNLRPALLLLDIRLPDCFGHDLLPQLRLLPSCEDAPAVAVTAEDDFSLAGTGFTELWQKPLDLQHVLSRLDALVVAPRQAAGHVGALHALPGAWASAGAQARNGQPCRGVRF